MRRPFKVLCGIVALLASVAQAAPLPDAQVPAPLKPWVGWVLRDADTRPCPVVLQGGDERACRWPGELALQLDAKGGRFQLDAQLYTPGWLELPGDSDAWPQVVTVDGAAIAAVEHDGHSAVTLPAGRHRIEGRWDWQRLPESLRVPADIGLVRLKSEGTDSANPLRSGDRLWLGKSTAAVVAQTDHLALKVYRLIDDDLPPRLTTQIELEVAGQPREAIIGPVLPQGWTPLSLGGGLPARLGDDGLLHVQLRPGLWRIEIVARASTSLKSLARPASAEPWPADEVWSFQAHPDLRVVDVGGATAVDPRQTQMPDEWRALPAYALDDKTTLTFDEKKRGHTRDEPDTLSLDRQIWLDFDGRGYTVQDHLAGRLQSHWRLETAVPLVLGQVLVDGEPQLITKQGEGVGVEVRRGNLDLSADSRIVDSRRSLPAHGWNVDVQQLSTTLHLPPAWRLIAAPGADQVPGSWLARWTLLDLFVVLIAAVAAFRLFGVGAGLLSLFTLVLIWHEPDAPRWSWINLIAALALLQVLPANVRGEALGRWVGRYRWIAAAIVLLVAVPFEVQQARLALYPQLSIPQQDAGSSAYGVAANEAMPAPAPPPERMVRRSPPMADAAVQVTASKREYNGDAVSSAGVSQQSIQQLDPKAVTQTGPGLPSWHWQSAELSWSGPVTGEQTLHLVLSPPWLTRSLQLLSILLIALTLLRWLRPGSGSSWHWRGVASGVPAMLVLALGTLASPEIHAQEVAPVAAPQPPPPALLDELRQRLLAPPECVPSCADLPRLRVAVENNEHLILRLTVDAVQASAIPLPLPFVAPGDQTRTWQPASLRLDDHAIDLRRDESGRLWAAVPAGRHELAIEGSLAGYGAISLPLPAKPRFVQSQIGTWQLDGVDELGRPAEALQLLRPAAAGSGDVTAGGEEQALPPLWMVTRELRFGLDWEIETTVKRLGSSNAAASTSVPLLAGERPTSENLRTRDNNVLVSLAPGQTDTTWTSRLPVDTALSLAAARRDDLFETWRFDISPLWHVDFTGLPPVGILESQAWLPSYRPWPGETLKLAITRPAGVAGQTLTLDHAALTMAPGQRATDITLSLQLRASQGGSHRLKLPPELKLQSLSIDGQTQTARQENGELVLSLHPGAQSIELVLRGVDGIRTLLRTPKLDLGLAGVNADLHLNLPRDRWVLLTGGPRLGPAVLFWGVLLVLVAIAFALGQVTLAPLRGWQWALLMIGLSQIPIAAAAAVAGWLFALGARGRYGAALASRRFNLMQIGLAVWTLLALGLLFGAVAQGLLGSPDMQIAGNGSSADRLQWYQDRFDHDLPTAWVLSVSIWAYRVLMLAWALWLANALLGWLRWGWEQFSVEGLWKRKPVVVPPAAEPN